MLRKLWGPSDSVNSLEDFVTNYYLFEKYYAQNFRIQAQDQLSFLNTDFEALLDSKNLNAKRLTRLRRQIAFLLQTDVALRSEDSFTLYTNIINAEGVSLGSASEAAQEIQLEVAQELLFFLKDLLDSNSRQDMAIILLRAYRNLKVATLSENLGRSVFSAQERSTLDKIQGLGTLSEDKFKAIQDSNRAAADALALFEELNTNTGPTVVSGPVGVQTEQDFVEALEDVKVLTQGMSFSLTEQAENNVMTFGQAMFEGYNLQGTFQSETQSFSFLKLGEVTENRATISSLAGFLNQMLAANKKLQKEGAVVSPDSGPNNYTSGAIVQRRNILNLLKQQGVNANFENVLLTNDALTKARVEDASFEKQYSLNFDFDLGPPVRIRNATVGYGRSTLLLAGQVFVFDTLAEDLLKAIDIKLSEEATENEEG